MSSIKTKILLVIAVLIGVQTFLAAQHLFNTHAEYRKLYLQRCRLNFDLQCATLNKVIDNLERDATTFAGQMEIRQSLPLAERQDAALIVQRVLEDSEHAIGGGLWFEPYRNMMHERLSSLYLFRKAGKLQPLPLQEHRNEYLNEPWYQTIKANADLPGRVVWSKPYYDTIGTHALLTTLGCGLFGPDNAFLGLVTIDWALADLTPRIASIRPTPNSVALFADVLNDFILLQTGPAGDSSGASVHALPWFPQTREGETRLDIDGVRHVSFMNTLDNDMALILNIPEDELLAPLTRDLRLKLIAAALCALLLLAGTFFLLHHYVSAPIMLIAAGAKAIGDGQLDTRIKVSAGGELGDLAQVLNTMTKDLRHYIETMHKMAQEKERIAAEMDVATHIQASMLPCLFPAFPNREEFALHASMRPARKVGGDFYDFFLIDDNHLAVVIADVSDKGIPAALFMVIAKTLLKNHLQEGLSPAQALRSANNQLCENNTMNMFVTVWLAVLELDSGHLIFADGGHNLPVLGRDGAYSFVDGAHNFVLGGMENMAYKADTLKLLPGDTLLLYTDGVTEAQDEHGAMFGDARLLDDLKALEGSSMEGVVTGLLDKIDAFAGNALQSDDITMLALKYLGPKTAGTDGPEVWKDAFAADMEAFPAANDALEAALAAQGCPGSVRNSILLVFEEIFVNVASYAYPKAAGDLTVTLRLRRESGRACATLRFQDQGVPFNPLLRQDPDITLSAEEREIGGLGIFMTKQLMDQVNYARAGNKNILTIRKTWESVADAASDAAAGPVSGDAPRPAGA